MVASFFSLFFFSHRGNTQKHGIQTANIPNQVYVVDGFGIDTTQNALDLNDKGLSTTESGKPQESTKERQTSERREKSRIAAKLRRNRENQALVELHLALPIQQNSTTDALKRKDCNKLADHAELANSFKLRHKVNGSRAELSGKSTLLLGVTASDLDSLPTYRLATTIFRQHNLAAPVLEKAVIIRIASNALYLYNWLYPAGVPGECCRFL